MNGSRVAVVSGGSRGIGRAVVLRLARDGFDVAFCFHRADKDAMDVAERARGLGVRVTAARVDVADADQVRAWVERTERELGAVQVVVAGAGMTIDGPLVLTRTEDWQAVIDTNLGGTFNLCRAAVFGMLKRRSGCVITMSSVSGTAGNAAQTSYSAAKAGIIGFTRALAKEVGSRGVRANVVVPGLIDTDMLDGLSEAARTRLTEATALKRLGRAEEVAELVGFVASDRASYITGSVLEVHGGIAL